MLVGSAALAWTAPQVISMPAVAAATGSGVPIIVSTTGTTLLDPPPTSVVQNVTESDTTTWLILEQQCVTLTSDVIVNRQTPGIFDGNSNELAVIPAGTMVSSFLLNADRATNGSLSGSIEFSAPILGLIYEKAQFDASNADVGLASITYATSAGAYVEGNDDFTLSSTTLDWTLVMAGHWSDLVRILVECDC